MPTNVKGLVEKPLRAFRSFTPGQKAVSIIAVVALLIGGYFFTTWSSKPNYAPLFTGLASADASAIVEELTASGTPYELADGGSTILVPQAQAADLRLTMAGQGLPANEGSGYSILDKQGLTASQFQQQVGYQRALEGELKNTIEAIDTVDTAVVHLALPEKDVFADEESKPTASVLVQTQPGTTLTSQQVRAVINLVSASVQGMAPQDVTLTDSTGKLLSNNDPNGAGAGADRDEATQAYEDRISKSVQTMLDRVVGAGHSEVRVTADLDYDTTQTKSETFVAPPRGAEVLSESTETEDYTGDNTAVTGVLGPDNIAVPNGDENTGSTYKKGSSTKDYAVGKTTEQRVAAPGSVKKMNVAVLLDNVTAGAVDPAEIQGLVSAAAGVDAARGDTIQVARMPFDSSAQDAAAKELADAQAAEKKAAMDKTIKTGVLAGVVLLVLLLTWLKARRARKQKRTPLDQIELARLEELERRNAELEAERRAALEAGTDAPALPAAPEPNADAENLARMRDDIGELVEQQPDEVAQLLRGWLADRRS
ncbi:flagellar basal-body MS-ring/collar protein FliF [Motilibacter aurantiacus]|uniref:flagellar basal-body MS-ring/collar protein FliF n=1 Tax=Motilibacter aurantiacus TaxID=2714955 RepID=UPI001407D21A|nr:flagellar basal-body MS-ring/collar protein FliF [Motilibacter aurantiacus]NHC47094.1 flagellar M-ring protein FliF [Motilibacter aurantiacus]